MNNEIDYIFAIVNRFGEIVKKTDSEIEAKAVVLQLSLADKTNIGKLYIAKCPKEHN